MHQLDLTRIFTAAALTGALVMSVGCDREQPQTNAPTPVADVQGAPLDSAPGATTAGEGKDLINEVDTDLAEEAKRISADLAEAATKATAPAVPPVTSDTTPPAGTIEPVKPAAAESSNTLAEAAAKAAADAEKRAAKAADGAPTEKPATAAEATDDALAAHKARLASQPLPKALAGYEPVRFDRLAGYIFLEDPPPAPGTEPPLDSEGKPRKLGDDQIPPEVKALDGKRVTLRGHMIPIDFHKFSTNEFILVQAVPDCYFCTQPMPNEWIEVKTLDGKRVPYAGDEAVTVAGTLRVGAVFKGRYLESLYRLELDQVVE